MMDIGHTPAHNLTRAREIAIKHGLRYVYTGNVHDAAGGTTHCHNCGHALIVRDWYELLKWNIKDGKCTKCGTQCAGVFENKPGKWGARRQPVRLREYAGN
jgi:pyruvate formate lyase activating enzyme